VAITAFCAIVAGACYAQERYMNAICLSLYAIFLVLFRLMIIGFEIIKLMGG
jgi:hypothetical protein